MFLLRKSNSRQTSVKALRCFIFYPVELIKRDKFKLCNNKIIKIKTEVSWKSDNVWKLLQTWSLPWKEGHTFPAAWEKETSDILESDIERDFHFPCSSSVIFIFLMEDIFLNRG